MAERDSPSQDSQPPVARERSDRLHGSGRTRLLGERALQDTFDRILDHAPPQPARRPHASGPEAVGDTLLAEPESPSGASQPSGRSGRTGTWRSRDAGASSPSQLDIARQRVQRRRRRAGSDDNLPTREYQRVDTGPGPRASRPFPKDELQEARETAEALEGSSAESEELDLVGPQEGEASHVIGDRYRILEGIGMGGMGAIFKVRHLDLGKTFALKIILSQLSADPTARRFFFREAQALSQLNHPNIVQVTDFGTDHVFGAYLVMEYLKGEPLADRLDREGRLPPRESLHVAIQLARALEYMHARELIHCDIKPENVFLCANSSPLPVVKLIDFGLSRHSARGAELVASEVAATPLYAAPEQLTGMAPTPAMDIYAVGAVLYEMITGTAPFDGTPTEILEQKKRSEVEPPSRRIDVPLAPPVEDLILSTLVRNPLKRCPTVEALIEGLREALEGLGESGPVTLRGFGRAGFRDTGSGTDLERTSASSLDAFPAGDLEELLAGTGSLAAAQAFCRQFPIPLVLLAPQGDILAASPSFCSMMKQAPSALQGTPVSQTRLGVLYPDLEVELAQALEQRQQILRRFDFRGPDGARSAISVWLAPFFGEGDQLQGVWGILVPVLEPAEPQG